MKTSVYLNKARAAAVEQSGRTLTELIDLGLEACGAPAERRRPRRKVTAACICPDLRCAVHCPHPIARRDPKNPRLCRLCGTVIG